ncbi:MAG: cupin domain-containing protein, partial [Oscillospiraceae bacterium]|nr:cupin domain-containing protein [Oscillospiraceae bacterium]
AAKLNIDLALYLEYEQNGKNIPISALYELANIYGLNMTEILTGKSPKLENYCAVKEGRGVGIERYPGYHFEDLAFNFKHRVMEPLMVTVDPDDEEPVLVSHSGQEFNYIVEGIVKVILGDEEVVLKQGECIYFNPLIPHGQKAVGGTFAKFLTVITEIRQ